MKLTYEQRDQNTRNFNAVTMPATRRRNWKRCGKLPWH